MPNLKDADRSIFSEAVHGVFDFTEQEIHRIGELAAELKTIVESAVKRQKEKIDQYK
jgi:hypothetical protein